MGMTTSKEKNKSSHRLTKSKFMNECEEERKKEIKKKKTETRHDRKPDHIDCR